MTGVRSTWPGALSFMIFQQLYPMGNYIGTLAAIVQAKASLENLFDLKCMKFFIIHVNTEDICQSLQDPCELIILGNYLD